MLMLLTAHTDIFKFDGAVRLINVFGVFLKMRGNLEDNQIVPFDY